MMKKLDLDSFFYPGNIAIIGVSSRNLNFGGSSFLVKLKESNFAGNLFPVNPKAEEVLGLKAYPDLSCLPETPDMAMVCVPAQYVPKVMNDCARIGTRHIHILTSGFKELGTPEGKQLESAVASIAREKGLFVMGPNCMGPYCPASGLTAWGAIPGVSGPVGVISQSGGITQRLTEYLYFLGVGVEKAVSIGNATVLNSLDYLAYMGQDDKIRVIALYLEGMDDGREFLELAREVGRTKPVIIWKGGQSAAGAATASSHTGSMAGEHRLWDAFFRQTGAMCVRSMDEWADAILAFSCLENPEGKGVFLIGGGGGHSVTNSDICFEEGLDVPPLSEITLSLLRKTVAGVGSIAGNPLDDWQTFGDPAYLSRILDLADADSGIHMAVVDRLIPRKAFHSFDETDKTAEVISALKKRSSLKPVVLTVDSEGGDPELAQKGAIMRARFCGAGIPAFPSLKRGVRALKHVVEYHHRRTLRQ